MARRDCASATHLQADQCGRRGGNLHLHDVAGAMRTHRSAIQTLTPIFAVACLVACEETLQVKDKGRLTPENTSSELLVAGAIHDFTVAYSGTGPPHGSRGERFLISTSLLADELYAGGISSGATDQRAQHPISDGNYSDGAYIWLHRARTAAVRAFDALRAEGIGRSQEASEMKFLEAMTYVALGEGFCSGLPFSEMAPDGSLLYGVPLSTEQVFEEAVSRFDEALAIDGDNDAAKVGKARALVNLGRYQEAAAVVAAVPTTFVREIEHSENSVEQWNPISRLGWLSVGVIPGDPDPVRDRRDPRILCSDVGVSGPYGLQVYKALKYSYDNSPVTLADGIEARLIEAEADLTAGGSQWLTIINDLRADVDNLMADRVLDYETLLQTALEEGTVDSRAIEPLVDPGTTDGRVDLIFSERAAWMYLTGHRLGDLRRLIRQYGRNPDDVFPSGPYFQGGSYGSDVVLPLAHREIDNPNWSTGMCSYTTP